MLACQRARFIPVLGLLLGLSLSAHAQTITAASACPCWTNNPPTLNLDNTSGPIVTQLVTLTTTSTTAIPFTLSLASTGWLTVTPLSGSVSANRSVTLAFQADATSLQIGNTYNVIVGVVYSGATQQSLNIGVNFSVQTVSGMTAGPSFTSWTYAPGGSAPSPQPITLSTTAATFSATVSSGATWLLLGLANPPANFTPQSVLISYPTFGGFTLVPSNLTTLSPGTVYNATVTITDANQNVAMVTVSLTVLGQGSGFTVSPTSLSLTTSGSAVTIPVTFSAPNPTNFTATASVTTPSGGTWLSVSPTAGATPENLTVTADPTGLAAGTYTGVITAIAGSLSAVVQVTFVVSTGAASGGNVVSDHASLAATYQVGGTVPPAQPIVISNQAAGSSPIPFKVSAVASGGSWLSVAVQGGGTQGYTGSTSATVLVNFSPQGLAAGTYYGTVSITPTGGNVLGIPVTLTVQAASTVTASPLQLSFSYQAGAAAPASQPLQVTGNASSLPFTVTTSTSSGGNWLSAAVSSGVTPAAVAISVSPGTLSVGSYQGTITISGSGIATGTTSVSVTLTIAVALPSITSVQNAASFATGPVAPGEIVSLFGASLGPVTPVYTTIDSTGKVSNNIGNVQVLFNGTAAPLTYVSATQINCVVPYEFASVSSPYVQVKYLGQGSNIVSLQQASTAPGIFAASAGQGQGAILNGDNTFNSSSKPAAKGSTIQVFMTGEGQLSPAGVTGSVTCSAGCATVAQIPKPLLAVAALVNGQPATIAYFGEASGDVSGVLQVDVVIPPNTPSGAVPIVILVGGNGSQANVTVAVQ